MTATRSRLEIDELPINDIEGIELYRGASTTPPQFTYAAERRAAP